MLTFSLQNKEDVKVLIYTRLLSWTKCLRAFNLQHLKMGQSINYTHNAPATIEYKLMHLPCFFTWMGSTREHTTLQELQEAQLYTTLDLDVQHCNRLLLVHIRIYVIKE